MLLHIALIAEIMATVICIHCIYGEKVELDFKTVGTVLGILTVLELINYYQLCGMFSFLGYVIVCVYCKYVFDSSVKKVVVNFLITIVIITTIQFMLMILIEICIPGSDAIKTAICNILLAVICGSPLIKWELVRGHREIHKKEAFLIPLLCFMCLVVLIMLLQKKIFYGMKILNFILVVPTIIMLLFMIVKWYMEKATVENMERKMRVSEETQEKYEDLLVNVRLRQHEFKNHMTAILSSHYTYKTYENLVKAQEEYCAKLMGENKYNNLLLMGDSILIGFLFEKFQEAEADGITVNYAICTQIGESRVPTYYIVEMLGILLDNAVDALKDIGGKIISFEVSEKENGYVFSIGNPYKYVSYDDISEWFMLGRSQKGNGRGLGLYHLRCLCEEFDCNIGFRNVEVNNCNWIIFTLEISKAEDM